MKSLATFLAVLTLTGVCSVYNQVPNTLSYQGLLTTAGGTPFPDGSYRLQFDLFNVSLGGVSLWTEVDSSISVQRGTFSIVLGSGSSSPAIFTQELFVQVTALSGPGLGAPMTFSPRSPLTSSPYSLALKTPASFMDSIGGNAYVLSVVNKDLSTGRGLLVQTKSFVGIKSLAPVLGVGGSNDPAFAYYETPSTGASGYSANGYGIAGFTDTGVALAGFPSTPAALAGYFAGKVVVQAANGDTAVQLPNNSIDSYEILDEPGIAATHHDSYVTLSPGLSNVDSITITSPSIGYVSVDASGICWLSHVTGTQSEVIITVDTSISFVSFTGFQFGWIPTNLPTASYPQNFRTHRVFTTPGGTQKFYLKGDLVSGAGTYYLGYFTLKATYYPTSYGPVSIIAPSASGGSPEQLSQAVSPAPDNATGRTPLQTTDLRELELRALKLREAAERAQNELLKATLANRKTIRQ